MEKTGVPPWRKKYLDAEKYLENWMKFLLFKPELMWTKKKRGHKSAAVVWGRPQPSHCWRQNRDAVTLRWHPRVKNK